MFKTNFLADDQVRELVSQHNTPLFIYSKNILVRQAKIMLALPAPYGLTVRYAMKANPHPEILQTLNNQGIKIDASSGYEAEQAMDAGFAPKDILLTSQQLPQNLKEIIESGVQFNATSLRQLEEFGKLFPGSTVSVRINPGIGSGHSAKANVGGVTSSFGIWYEYTNQVHSLAETHDLTITRMHTHIGSGTDPAVWQQTAQISLELIKQFPDAETINLGGGFKVARMDDEQGSNMDQIGTVLSGTLQTFAKATGRKLHLELEPGTLLVATAGILITQVEDIIDTGKDGYNFLKLNTGMNDILRPSLYGAQHPITVLNDTKELVDYIVVGHNCESGDLLTPAPGKPETVATRQLTKAKAGDIVLIGGAGAYCASMAVHGYNSFPSAKEIAV